MSDASQESLQGLQQYPPRRHDRQRPIGCTRFGLWTGVAQVTLLPDNNVNAYAPGAKRMIHYLNGADVVDTRRSQLCIPDTCSVRFPAWPRGMAAQLLSVISKTAS